MICYAAYCHKGDAIDLANLIDGVVTHGETTVDNFQENSQKP
jgi:hypothetical protein